MGLAKAELMRQDDLQRAAEGAALRANAVRTCELHEDIILDVGDPEAERKAYAIGTNMVKAGEVDSTREEFMDAIKVAIESSGEECPICAKYRDE